MYDYVIIGGGSAGCVLAARLTEDREVRVLLLEAGPPDRNPYIHMPVGFAKMTGGSLTWGYKTAPQRHCNDRAIPFAQARVLGGGSSINAEVFTRGCPEDFDRWAKEFGCEGWSYEEVRPYHRQLEGNDTFCDERHGVDGPLRVSTVPAHPMTRVFVQACQQAGIPHTDDFNGSSQTGCGVYQTTTRDGRRSSAATGYLRPALDRPNLEVVTRALVERIDIEGGRAVGATFVVNGRRRSARAEAEVILAAGAIGSPKLLMLSGVGPAAHLRANGIEVVADVPGVGENLHDHFDVDVVYELRGRNSFDKYDRLGWMLWAGLQYAFFRTGPAASNIVEGGAFWYADREAATPDTQFHFLAGAGVEAGVPPVPSGAGVTLNSYFVRPRSRGTVTLQSANPADMPLIDPNYIADSYDLRMTVEGVRMMREIMTQSVFSPHIRKEHFPGGDVRTDADFAEYARSYGRTSYHPVGTCRMGGDDASVVDPSLRARSVDRLRICDSSVMPCIVSSNTNATTIMIAERASDLIRGG